MLLSGPVTDQRVSMFLYLPLSVPRVLMVRATDPRAVVPLIKARVFALDARQPVAGVALAEDTYADLFARQRFVLLLMTAFSTVAVLLAAAGIFGVLSQAVLRRTREIGVRVALGATPRDILWLILSRGLGLAAIGTAAGVVGALAVSRVMTSLLFGISANDPISYASVATILMAVAFVACWLPTRRAMRIEPAVALRVE
jgi:ABC-type antimicrobial peptide transport system permease subunit